MNQDLKLNYKRFTIASVISIILGISILALSQNIGKNKLFLLLNTDLGKPADYFFEYFTHLGDAVLWIIWLAWIFIKKQKPVLPLVISSFAWDTILTQVCKQVILPNEPRPSEAIKDGSFIHYVEGVTVHAINSFPSGHTATAFTFVLLIALTTNKNWWIYLSMLVALLVGYSRVYLGQHFPFDVGGGILVAVIAVYLSTFVQKWFDKRRAFKKENLVTGNGN